MALFPLYDENPTTRAPVVTVTLILINLAVFFYQINQPPAAQVLSVVNYGLISERFNHLGDKPLAIQVPGVGRVQPLNSTKAVGLTLLTHMFMHGSWMHVLLNMWFLWIFGNNIEDRLGHGQFLAFYLVGGLVAAGVHYTVEPTSLIPTIGASGAVCAVLGAYAVTYPFARVAVLLYIVPLRIPAILLLGFFFVMDLLAGWAAPGAVSDSVAVWAHIGGFVGGLLLMTLIDPGEHS